MFASRAMNHSRALPGPDVEISGKNINAVELGIFFPVGAEGEQGEHEFI